MKRFLKKHGLTLLILLAGLAGAGLVAYPTVSDWWNSRVQTRAITAYDEAVAAASGEELAQARLAAAFYNRALYDTQRQGVPADDTLASYEEQLNLNGDGIMGYIVIPAVDVRLPIYHGTAEKTLQVAVGHAPSSSLPVGGDNTHAMLLGHRGLPSARLFTDLDQLAVGDDFELHILGEVLTYRVCEVVIVEPSALNHLRVEPGRDLVTLATCTPYGVNTHRLLVVGERTEGAPAAGRIVSDARRVSSGYAALVIGAVLWAAAMAAVLIVSTRRRTRGVTWEERQRRRKILNKYRS